MDASSMLASISIELTTVDTAQCMSKGGFELFLQARCISVAKMPASHVPDHGIAADCSPFQVAWKV